MINQKISKHEDILSVLSELDFVGMIDLYIEAKTGEHDVLLDNLPTACTDEIEQLGNYLESELNAIFTDDISFK